MDKESALKIFRSRKLITVPGLYLLKVTSTTPFRREDGTVVNITNYAAMTPYHLDQAKALAAKELWQEATNQALSSSQRINNDYLPAKGEFVNVLVETIKNKEDINILAIVSVTAIKASTASNVSFDSEEVSIAEPEAALV